MFVKVITGDHEDIYECYHAHHHTPEDNPDVLFMRIALTENRVINLELDKRDTDVYFMNEEGKTVDRLVWR